MICPKCGTTQANGREDCSRCGIVFGRWNPTASRPRTLSSTPIPDEPPQRTPVSLIAVGLLVLILAGLVWTKHRHDVRSAAPTTDEMLNNINNAQIAKAKERRTRAVADAQKQESAMTPVTHPNDPRLPSDLDEQMIRGMIETCGLFNERVTAALPKSYSSSLYEWTMQRYPALPMAITDHLVDLERGPTTKVTLTAPAILVAPETEDEYHLDMGRRRIDTVMLKQVYDTSLQVTFSWTTERPEGADLAPEGRDRSGGADLVKSGNRWVVGSVWRTQRGITIRLGCK